MVYIRKLFFEFISVFHAILFGRLFTISVSSVTMNIEQLSSRQSCRVIVILLLRYCVIEF